MQSMWKIVVVALALAAVLGLQGCDSGGGSSGGGGSGGSGGSNTCLAMYKFPSEQDPSGEPISLTFEVEECCDDLTTVFKNLTYVTAMGKLAAQILAGQKPKVDQALKYAMKPICDSKCPVHLKDCDHFTPGAFNQEKCEADQMTMYTSLFQYMCNAGEVNEQAAASSVEMSAGSCGAMYKFPSGQDPSGEPIFLTFGVEQCCDDLTTVFKTGTYVTAIAELGGQILAGQKPKVDQALKYAMKPICDSKCPVHLKECHHFAPGAFNQDRCDEQQMTMYTSLFQYICKGGETNEQATASSSEKSARKAVDGDARFVV